MATEISPNTSIIQHTFECIEKAIIKPTEFQEINRISDVIIEKCMDDIHGVLPPQKKSRITNEPVDIQSTPW